MSTGVRKAFKVHLTQRINYIFVFLFASALGAAD